MCVTLAALHVNCVVLISVAAQPVSESACPPPDRRKRMMRQRNMFECTAIAPMRWSTGYFSTGVSAS